MNLRVMVLLAVPLVALSQSNIRVAPGDDKTGYERSDYTTDSLSLELRQGKTFDLAAHTKKRHLGLPPFSQVQEGEPDAKKIELGRKLFFDRRLSRNKTMSCAMCHIPEQGFSNNELKRPIGFEGRGLKRNAPTLLNVIYYKRYFVDARENSLAQQVWSPLLAANEMNNPSVGYVVDQIRADPEYRQQFMAAYNEPANMLNIGTALAQYEQTLVAGNSRFDRWHFGNETMALSTKEQAGYHLFTGRAGCSVCHTVNEKYALFTDQQLHNTGVGYQASMASTGENTKVQIAPGVVAEITAKVLQKISEPKANDLGRYEVTQNPEDRWKFRTPSLRNIALTAPYMHNGEFLNLVDVVQFYNRGGVEHDLLSPLLKPLELTKQEQELLVAFLLSLTGEDVVHLVADAFAAPVSDTSTED